MYIDETFLKLFLPFEGRHTDLEVYQYTANFTRGEHTFSVLIASVLVPLDSEFALVRARLCSIGGACIAGSGLSESGCARLLRFDGTRVTGGLTLLAA